MNKQHNLFLIMMNNKRRGKERKRKSKEKGNQSIFSIWMINREKNKDKKRKYLKKKFKKKLKQMRILEIWFLELNDI